MKKILAAFLGLAFIIGMFASCMRAPVRPGTNPGDGSDQTTKDTAPVEEQDKSDKSSDDDDFIKVYDEKGHPTLPKGVEVGQTDAVSYYDFVDSQTWEKFNNYVFSDLSPFDRQRVTVTENGSVMEVPLLAEFMQYTGYSAFLLFGNDGGLIGIQTEKEGFDPALVTPETVGRDAEISLTGGKTVRVKTGTSASRCRVFSEWAKENGNSFIPVAARLSSDNTGVLEMIGRLDENGRLVVAGKDRLEGTGIELEYIPAVTSLSAAAEAYRDYVGERLRFVKEELFLFPWKSELLAGRSAYEKLISTSVEFDGNRDGDYIGKLCPDEVIAIPMAYSNAMLDNKGWEGECMLFILFRSGKAIGEVVLEFYHPWATVGLDDPSYYKGQYSGKFYERLGEKTDGGYKPLDHIEYVSFIQSLGDLSKVAGIYADAGGYHAIMK
ncbi:MAG: hypothetical protein IJU75_04500 [Clostridia bacterium]|nr:hypothetical protein [Clostridia bacterium]